MCCWCADLRFCLRGGARLLRGSAQLRPYRQCMDLRKDAGPLPPSVHAQVRAHAVQPNSMSEGPDMPNRTAISVLAPVLEALAAAHPGL